VSPPITAWQVHREVARGIGRLTSLRSPDSWQHTLKYVRKCRTWQLSPFPMNKTLQHRNRWQRLLHSLRHESAVVSFSLSGHFSFCSLTASTSRTEWSSSRSLLRAAYCGYVSADAIERATQTPDGLRCSSTLSYFCPLPQPFLTRTHGNRNLTLTLTVSKHSIRHHDPEASDN